MASKWQLTGGLPKTSAPRTNQSELISAPDACRILGIHRSTLYRLIEEGDVPAFRLSTGGRWRFNRKDLQEWLSDRQARRAAL